MPIHALFSQFHTNAPAGFVHTTSPRCPRKPVKEFFMPITQAAMMELMHESRAAIQNNKELRHILLQYLASAKERYGANRDLGEVAVAAMTIINMHPYPDDRITYRNEWHYRRVGRSNETNRKKQAIARRIAGVLTQEESMERLTLLNSARRSGDLPSQTYAQFNAGVEPKVTRGRKKDEVKMPREYPQDKPLEFETLEELPRPADADNLAPAPSFTFDEPEDKY